jgi:tetratricopeptide (TPR) repeat protein
VSEVDDIRKKRTERFMAYGLDCLNKGELEGALGAGRELEALRHTSAYEIAACAHAAAKRPEEAVRLLERGVSVAPDCWRNWELLGIYQSDLGRYAEAAEAFERALACPGPWVSSVRVNHAILESRRGNHEGALQALDFDPDPFCRLRAEQVRANELFALGRLEEAGDVAARVLASEARRPEDGETLARAAATLGRVRLRLGRVPQEVRRDAIGALEHDEDNPALLSLILEIDGRDGSNSRAFRLIVHIAELPSSFRPPRETDRFMGYDVVADTQDEALEFVRGFEVASGGEPELAGSFELETRPGDLKGVYWRSEVHVHEEET